MSSWTPTKDGETRLRSIIRKLTTSGEPELNKDNLRELKQICQEGGDLLVQMAYEKCMHHLKKPHSQIRVSTVQLIDYLFRKTHKFRTLLLDEFDTFLELTIQVTQDRETQVKLPPPKKYASILMEITAKYIYKWQADYSTGYEKLKYAYCYLREHNIVDFGQFRVNNREDLLHRVKMQERRDRHINKLIEGKIKDLDELLPDMEELIVQIESMLDIVIPSVEESNRMFDSSIEDSYTNKPTTQDDNPNQTSDEKLQEHGMLAASNHVVQIHFSRYVAITKEDANKAIIDKLKEFRRQLVEKKLNQLNIIIKTLSRKTEICSDQLKRAIKLKHRAMNSVIKMSELEIVSMDDVLDGSKYGSSRKRIATLHHDSSEGDSEFEEVQPKEDLESYIPKHLLSEYGLEPALPESPDKNIRLIDDDIFSPSTSGLQSNIIRQCNALLPNGMLCPRKDKAKCPFHGIIVERNSLGEPVNEEDRIRETRLKELKSGEVPEWQDPTLLMEIKLATGIDLTMPSNRKKSDNGHSRRNNKLQNTKTCDVTPQQRLQKRMKKISSI